MKLLTAVLHPSHPELVSGSDHCHVALSSYMSEVSSDTHRELHCPHPYLDNSSSRELYDIPCSFHCVSQRPLHVDSDRLPSFSSIVANITTAECTVPYLLGFYSWKARLSLIFLITKCVTNILVGMSYHAQVTILHRIHS